MFTILLVFLLGGGGGDKYYTYMLQIRNQNCCLRVWIIQRFAAYDDKILMLNISAVAEPCILIYPSTVLEEFISTQIFVQYIHGKFKLLLFPYLNIIQVTPVFS